MSEAKQILNNLYQLKKSMPQNPVTKLDDVNTVLHILAVKKKIKEAADDKLKKDYQCLLDELEIHYQELSRKGDARLSHEDYKASFNTRQ